MWSHLALGYPTSQSRPGGAATARHRRANGKRVRPLSLGLRFDQVLADVACIRSDTGLSRLNLGCTVYQFGDEVSAFIDEANIVGFTDFSGRNVDGLSSALLVSNCITAVTYAVYSNRLDWCVRHPLPRETVPLYKLSHDIGWFSTSPSPVESETRTARRTLLSTVR